LTQNISYKKRENIIGRYPILYVMPRFYPVIFAEGKIKSRSETTQPARWLLILFQG